MPLTDLYDSARGRAAYTLTLLRVCTGAIFLVHGWQKLGDLPGTLATFGRLGFPLPEWSMYLTIFSELVGGFGLLVGMRTPLAALGPLLTTALAMFFIQGGHGLPAERGGWEFSLVLCALCLHFAVRGAGIYSVDAMVAPGRPRFRRRHRQVATTT